MLKNRLKHKLAAGEPVTVVAPFAPSAGPVELLGDLGLDGVFFVAPGDLAQSMGYPGQMDHPQVFGAINDALRRIRAAGRVSGALTTPNSVDRDLALGVQYLYVSLTSLLTPAAAAFIRRVR